MRPLLIDLFCGAGGAAKGYHDAGFEVVGVDINPQPNYPFQFLQADALDWRRAFYANYLISRRDTRARVPAAFHASPPCQAHLTGLRGVNKALGREDGHFDLISETRLLLTRTGKPYVIENIVGAPLLNPVQLCGSSFGLPIRRHRRFESNVAIVGLPCEHHKEGEKKYWTSFRGKSKEYRRSSVVQVYGSGAEKHHWGPALGIDWMTSKELTQAIPPVYTEHIGKQIIGLCRERVA